MKREDKKEDKKKKAGTKKGWEDIVTIRGGDWKLEGRDEVCKDPFWSNSFPLCQHNKSSVFSGVYFHECEDERLSASSGWNHEQQLYGFCHLRDPENL